MRIKPCPGTLDAVFNHCNPYALDLLKKMLAFHPEQRIDVTGALEHPYLAIYHCEDDEPVSDGISHFDFEFENQLLDAADLKEEMY